MGNRTPNRKQDTKPPTCGEVNEVKTGSEVIAKMSRPDDSWEYLPSNVTSCPYCKAPDQEGEDLGDHPAYLSYKCSECNRDFARDTMREENYDEKGNVIK